VKEKEIIDLKKENAGLQKVKRD